jgi:SAM-dependent methyltransferase
MAMRCCPACGSTARRARGQKNNLELNSCRACGTLYAYRANSAGADAREDYDAYYHEANLTVPAFVDKRLNEIVAEFAPFRRSNRLLDIGCGAGTLLQAARRAGWEAEGVEVSRPAVEHVRGLGFTVFHGELAAAQHRAAYFDVVTASEVLEHLPEPGAMVAEIARILRPGGLFWGTTPHGRGLSACALGLRWSNVQPPEHLQLFSLGGVRTLFAAAGFRRVRLAARGVNPFELWHALRHGAGGQGPAGTPPDAPSFDRVASGYQLNESLTRNGAARLLKGSLNAVLSAARCGDSIKIWAVK